MLLLAIKCFLQIDSLMASGAWQWKNEGASESYLDLSLVYGLGPRI